MHYPSWTIITSDVCIRVPLRHHSLINMTSDVCIRTYQWETYVPSRHICKYSLKYSNFIGYCAFRRVNANKQRVLTRSNFTRFVNRLLAPIAFHNMQTTGTSLLTVTSLLTMDPERAVFRAWLNKCFVYNGEDDLSYETCRKFYIDLLYTKRSRQMWFLMSWPL